MGFSENTTEVRKRQGSKGWMQNEALILDSFHLGMSIKGPKPKILLNRWNLSESWKGK